MHQSFIIIAVLLGLSGAARAQSDYWQRQYQEQQRWQQQNHERQMREQRQRHEQQTRERQRQFEQQQRQNQQMRNRQYQQQPSYRQYQQPSYRQNSYSGSSNSDVTFSDEEMKKLLNDSAYLKYLKKLSSDLQFRSAINDYLTPQQREMLRKKLSEADSVSAKREVLTGSLVIREGVTSIKAYAYSRNRLDSVTIPDGVVTIENGAFNNNRIVYVSIPGSVVRIGDFAFQQNRLTDIALPDSLKEIGDYAFGYNKITSVVIPPSVTKIGTNPFGLNNDAPTRITIGSNVEVGRFFGLGIRAIAPFNEFYDSNGKKAGTYVYNNGAWNME